MSVNASVSADGRSMTIRINGWFDFISRQEFRQAYEKAGGTASRYVIDMRDAMYVGGAALSMMLMLWEYAGGEKSDVRIANCRDEIKSILNSVNFQKLFFID